MRTVPLSKSSVMPLLLAAVLPLLIMLELEIPIGQLLANMAKALLQEAAA
jgi:hypothetical protein